MRSILLFCLVFCALPFHGFAQWAPGGASTANTQVRTGVTGIGFTVPLDAFTAANGRTRFLVNGTGNDGGILAHFVSGFVGDFGSKWCGLGIGNPTGTPSPYGLAIADSNNVGFYNLLRENFNGASRNNTIAGFGFSSANTPNTNRFIVRGYSGANAATGRNLIIANPNGSVSINAEPLQAGPDLSTTFYVDGAASDARFRAIFINNLTTTPTNNAFSSFSAIGKEGNVTNPGLDTTPIEGFRAQFTNRGATSPFQLGTAVNLQVLRNPNAVPPPFIDAVANSFGGELADLYWQDLGYAGPATTDPNLLAPAFAQALDKFTISFRNANPNGPFVAGNRLPIMTFQGNGRVGIGQVAPVSPISFFGLAPILLDVNGGLFSNVGYFLSDRRLKQDIAPVQDAMSLVRRLQGTTYNFRTSEFPNRHLPGGKQYGFIAQDLEKVIPEAAAQDDNGFYAVNYNAIIPVLTEAIKEQDKTITELRTELAELRSQFADFKAGQQGGDAQGFRLEQNAPNPFGQSTIIRYALPASTTGARISVYDLSGRLLKAFPVSGTEGQVEMQANTLSDGLYIYDLQVNGKQILERKMSVVKG